MTREIAALPQEAATSSPALRSTGASSRAGEGQRQHTRPLRTVFAIAAAGLASLATVIGSEAAIAGADLPVDHWKWEIAEGVILLVAMLAFAAIVVGTWREFLRETADSKRAEQALRESEERFRSVTETASDAIVCIDNQGRIVLWNNAAETALGYSSDEVVGKPLTLIMPKRFREAHRTAMDRAASTGRPHVAGKTVELVGLKKDGSEFPVELSLSTWKTADGVFFTGVVRDITNRKRMEEALRESEEKYRDLVENINEIIYEVDAKGRITYISPAVEEVGGYIPSEIVGRRFTDFLHPDDHQMLAASFQRGLSGVQEPNDYRLFTKRGGIAWFRSNGRPIYKGDRVVGFRGVLTDISEHKRMEEDIRKFKTISDRAGYGSAIANLEGNLVYVNEAFASMHGYRQQELMGRNLSIFHNDEQLKNVDRLNDRLTKEGGYVAEEVWHTKKDGTVFPTLMTGTLIRDQNGSPLFMAATSTDISERKRMEEALQQAREELEARVEHQMLRRNPYRLTFRELTVLHLVAAGESDRQIGLTLGISHLTAQKHISNILGKMEAGSRTEAGVRAVREGLLD